LVYVIALVTRYGMVYCTRYFFNVYVLKLYIGWVLVGSTRFIRSIPYFLHGLDGNM